MSFYLGKTVKAGPFRVSLSRSGIGMSTGVPGLRVGTGPRGSYCTSALVPTAPTTSGRCLSPAVAAGLRSGRLLPSTSSAGRRLTRC